MDYSEKLKKYAERRAKIVALHQRKFTDEEIGRMMNPKVSKQAISKILRKERVR